MNKLCFCLALSLAATTSHAGWFTSKIDRLQALPNGNIAFWLTTIPSGNCGASDNVLRAEVGQYGVDTNGVKMIGSIVLSASMADKSLDISVKDSACRVDSVTIHK